MKPVERRIPVAEMHYKCRCCHLVLDGESRVSLKHVTHEDTQRLFEGSLHFCDFGCLREYLNHILP